MEKKLQKIYVRSYNLLRLFLLQVEPIFLCGDSVCFNLITVKRLLYDITEFMQLYSHSLVIKMGCYCIQIYFYEACDYCIYQFLDFSFSKFVRSLLECFPQKI